MLRLSPSIRMALGDHRVHGAGTILAGGGERELPTPEQEARR